MILAAAFAAAPALADQTQDDGGFYDGNIHAQLTPYVWLPTINGTFRYNLSDIQDYIPIDQRNDRHHDRAE